MIKLVEKRGSFSLQGAVFYIASLLSNSLSKFWFQETVQSSLNCFFFKCFSSCFSSHAAGWIPAENKIDLTGMSRCLFLFFSLKARGKKHDSGSLLFTCILWHTHATQGPQWAPQTSILSTSCSADLHSSRGKKSWYCYLNCTHRTNTYRKKS